jgi:hypothetical protein
MKIIVTEQQYKILVNEVNRSFDYSEDKPVYNYKSIAVLLDQKDPKIFRAYFNGNDYQKTDYELPFFSQNVIFKGPNGDFIFNKNHIRISSTNSPFVSSVNMTFTDENYKRLYELIDKTQLNKKNKINEIQPWQIRKSLELAFSAKTENSDGIWIPGDGENFTSGVRGVYTIGKKLGTKETWSILNYFDTKREIQKKIVETYNKDSKTNLSVINWLIEKLKNKDSFIDYLVDEIQWPSINSGLESEKLAEKFIGTNNAEFYPPGSVMDRWKGVDMTYEGINYQIKPLKSYSILKNIDKTTKLEYMVYEVNTYGMGDYKDKELVHKILFVNESKMLEFDNVGYSSTFSNVVTFDSPPTKIYNVIK